VDTALALDAAGVEVTLFADARAELPAAAAALRERVVRLDPLPAPMERPRVAESAFLATKLSLSRRFGRALAKHPVDVLHVFSPGTAAIIPRGTPIVVQAWFNPPRLPARLRTMLQFARRFPPLYAAHVAVEMQAFASDLLGYRRASVVLVNTVTAERDFRARGLPARHLPPGIALPAQPPVADPSDAFRIAFCGHPLDRPRKGVRYLLEALPLLDEGRPVHVTLVGGPGPKLEEPIEAARRAGVEVTLLGHVPRQAYLDHLASGTDMLAFMSLYEEWGYALLEAFSQGVPALAFDLYPFFEIVDRDTGLLVAPRDPRAVAEGIDRARAGELPERDVVLRSARARFGADSVAARLIPIYEELA
jgi:glycosyltransferase involved in cell wall biosynthesis